MVESKHSASLCRVRVRRPCYLSVEFIFNNNMWNMEDASNLGLFTAGY